MATDLGRAQRPNRPLLVIDLEPGQEDRSLDGDALYVYDGKLWRYDPAPCIACVERDSTPASGTLRLVDNEAQCVCLTHGALEEVPTLIRRDYLIQVGAGFERRGSQEVSDVLLIPRELNPDERTELCRKIIEAAASAEDEDELV